MSRIISPTIGMAALVLLGACGGSVSTPAVNLSVAPNSIAAGQVATLTWTSTNVTTCQASGGVDWVGKQTTSGSFAVSPQTPGNYTYTLECSSGGAAARESVTLKVTPAPLVITGGLDGGVVGTPFNESIQVTGGVAPYAWTVTTGSLPHNLSISPSTTNTVTIDGTPDTPAQNVTFTIEVTDSSHEKATETFTVSTELPGSSLVLSASNLNFGNQIVGNPSGALALKLTNTASSAMVVSNISISGNPSSSAGEFAESSSTCGASLAAGESCTVNVTFKPSQTGQRVGTLYITDDALGSPQPVPLLGMGLTNGPNVTLWSSGLSLGTQLVGTTSPALSVNLSNYGTAALNVGSIAASAQFAETDNCVGSVAAGATCTIFVTFTPGGPVDVTGTLTISDDAPASPQTVSLAGTGATDTPTLTGRCYYGCESVPDTADCPVGQRSEHPATINGCQNGPLFGFPRIRVDESRRCKVANTWRRGFCATD
jgi:hypothetical protein